MQAAEANLVVTESTASHFFHPYYELDALVDIVEGVQGAGDTLVAAGEFE